MKSRFSHNAISFGMIFSFTLSWLIAKAWRIAEVMAYGAPKENIYDIILWLAIMAVLIWVGVLIYNWLDAKSYASLECTKNSIVKDSTPITAEEAWKESAAPKMASYWKAIHSAVKEGSLSCYLSDICLEEFPMRKEHLEELLANNIDIIFNYRWNSISNRPDYTYKAVWMFGSSGKVFDNEGREISVDEATRVR